MTPSSIAVTPSVDPTLKKLDTITVVTAEGTVHREVLVIGDPDVAAAIAAVLNADPGAAVYGQVMRIVGTVPLPSGAATAAQQTDGTQKAITRSGAKGASAAADMTSTAEGADHQTADVQIYHGNVAINPTDRKSTRLNSSHSDRSRMPSSA